MRRNRYSDANDRPPRLIDAHSLASHTNLHRDKQNDLSNQEVINECRTNDGAGLEPSPNGKTAAAGRGEHAVRSSRLTSWSAYWKNLLAPGDRVVLEGNNQKQADFLSRMLAEVNPQKIHDLHMIMPSVGRSEHLDLFEKGIARKLDFSFSGTQSLRISQLLEDGLLEIGAIHTYIELYSRLYVDLSPNVALIAGYKADRKGNLYTGPSTEDTPALVEAAAFHDGIVIAQVNELVDDECDLPRVDIPGSWIDYVVVADKPFFIEPLFTRDPRLIKQEHILMAMMAIKGIYAEHQVQSLNHGIGFNTAAIELLLPTYGEQLGLKGKICKHWTLNPHPTLIPAIRAAGWRACTASAANWGWKSTSAPARISSLPARMARCALTAPSASWRASTR